ncbi:MAG TPA: tRNA (adenosine(37)-N6)-threonylcarbamoyltransferase complex dimerization subunit type 1 TsaB [Sedimentisphaerales bacterium]|nr:tRNA (adenosine(37)-N6)-threonylcarbamoyltransferase complex dimerization subunit type 1 TsaB [Sedimentisphaerales bacterium]
MNQKPLVLAVETSSRIGSVVIAFGEKILAETTFSAPIRHSAEIFPAISDILQRFSRKPDQIEQVHISVGPGSFTGLRIAVTLAKTLHLANAAKIVAVDTLDVIVSNVTDYIKEENTTTTFHSEASPCHSEHSEVEEPLSLSSTPIGEWESPERFAAILDAKRGRFFIAVYKRLHESTVSFLRNLSSTPIGEQESNSHYPLSAIRYPLIKLFPDSLMTASEFLDKFARDENPIWLLGDGLLYYKDKFKADSTRFLEQKYWSPRASKVHLLGWKKALTNQFADPLTLTPNYLLRPDIKIKQR